MADVLASIRHRMLMAFACLWLGACTSTHGPSGSTETGNPPVIDLLRVALQVSADMVLITGEPGAIEPGGAAVEITNLATGAVTMTVAMPNGSFSVEVDGSANDAYSVRASAGGMASKPVFIVRGGAMVSSGTGDSLSCDQRKQLAKTQLELAAANVNTSCSVDADCDETLVQASCYHTCQATVASAAGVREIEAAAAAVGAGLCSTYTQDGCPSLVTTCPLPRQGKIMCSAGKCVRGPVMMETSLTCEDRRQTALNALIKASEGVDHSCKLDADCMSVPQSLTCAGSCNRFYIARAGESAFDAARASISEQYCPEITQNSCSVGQSPCPPGPMASRCNAGTCVAASTLPQQTCQQRANEAATRLMESGAAADRSCSQDADCVQVPVKLTCHDTCGYFQTLSQAGKTALEAEAASIESTICSDFTAAGCLINLLPCLPSIPGIAKCADGKCYDMH